MIGRMHRWLTHVQPRKFKDRIRNSRVSGLAEAMDIFQDQILNQSGKDALSLEAHKLTNHLGYPRGPYYNDMAVHRAKNELTELQGRMNSVLSVENSLRAHIRHLESIVDGQAGEIRQLKAQLESLRGRKRTWGIFPRIHKNN